MDDIQLECEELLKKQIKEFLKKGNKIIRLPYYGPRDTQTVKIKRKKSVKGKMK